MSTHAALDEVLQLAKSYVSSAGVTRAAVDPDEGGHGVKMLPDVVQEARDLVARDEVLKAKHPERRIVLGQLLDLLLKKENITQAKVEQLAALAIPLRRSAISDAFAFMEELAGGKNNSQAVVNTVEGLVSELRDLGWSDEALREKLDLYGGEQAISMSALRDALLQNSTEFVCFVPVRLAEGDCPIPNDVRTIEFVDEIPAPTKGRPVRSGTGLKVRVVARDPYSAAGVAHRRVLSTLGALGILFSTSPQIGVTGWNVIVEVGKERLSVEVAEQLVEERRRADIGEQIRIVKASWSVGESRKSDPLHDALRLRHRALLASENESRLLLLWSSLERLTSGAQGFDTALSAATGLIPKAIALGKFRRDVGNLTKQIALDNQMRWRLVQMTGEVDERQPDRVGLVRLLVGTDEEFRRLTEIVYEKAPLLAFRCHELRNAVGKGTRRKIGPAMKKYLEDSRVRVSGQVGRLYRARNRIAHVGVGPERVRDLVWHAHLYLTQIAAICVHYSENLPQTAQQILTRRAGQYDAFISLLEVSDPQAISVEGLLRPSVVTG